MRFRICFCFLYFLMLYGNNYIKMELPNEKLQLKVKIMDENFLRISLP